MYTTYIDEINCIKEKHKFACLLRDGCDGQIRAGPKITSYNQSKGRNIITGKYSGGCSMTQSMNDGGSGHHALHLLFESKHFKMRPYADPANSQYKALKTYLEKYLTPASLKTYWSFLCAFEPYVKKAINPVTVKSAARKSGFEGDKINIETIMSYNDEFCRMSHEKSTEVLGLITTVLAPYFRDNQWIPEALYAEVFPDLQLSTREGTHLNNLTTNRQRFLVDNSEQWQGLLATRKAVIAAAEEEKDRKRLLKDTTDALKPKKSRCCSHLTCESEIDITTAAVQKLNQATWRKCKGRGCSTWTCPTHSPVMDQHQNICKKCTV